MGQSILTPDQQTLLAAVLATPGITNTFYLTGGTALAEFYFQHRISEDFDFFSEKPFVETEVLEWVKKTAQKLKVKEVEYKTLNGQLTFFFHFPESIIKVDFAQYPFPHVGEFYKYKNLRVASVLDIGVNKLQAIQTRSRGRDFVDLFFILTKGNLSVEELIRSYRNKFDLVLSKEEIAKHFANVVEAVDQPKFLGDMKWTEIEKFFLNQAKESTKDFLIK